MWSAFRYTLKPKADNTKQKLYKSHLQKSKLHTNEACITSCKLANKTIFIVDSILQ